MIKSLLQKAVVGGEFTIDSARELSATNWRDWITGLSSEIKKDAEDLFYFIEGYVEETDEGFIDELSDPELYERTIELLNKL